jgi:ubiquinone/menaquinone biosynthesis C-methylase UbiE
VEVISEKEVREAELSVMRSLEDWLVYVIDPKIYDKQPFLNWDSKELLEVVDFNDKIVLDIGAGTGRLAFVAAKTAKTVYLCS